MLEAYRRVLVTGGAGFIGSYVCDEILSHGREVVIVDDLSTGKMENIPAGAEFIQLDIAEGNGLDRAFRGVDIVFHVAAQPSTRISVEDPLRDFKSNVIGTWNLLKLAREKKVKKFVYTSTSAVYGEPKQLPMKESDLPEPTTPYGVSKLSAEHYALVFQRAYGLPVVCLRPFNVYGPRENMQVSQDEVAAYTLAVMQGRPVTIQGDGKQTRDYIYVKDVAHAHVLAAETDDGNGKVINVGTGTETSINHLVQEIEAVLDKKAKIKQNPWSQGDVYREYGDTCLARDVIKFFPMTALRAGIEELVRLRKSAPVA